MFRSDRRKSDSGDAVRRMMCVLHVVLAWLLMGTCLTAAADNALANPYDDPILREAHDRLYTGRDRAIRILEDAVRRAPDNVDYWAELVHTLTVDGQYPFADRAAREGLDRHGDHPLLIYAWAKSKLWRWPEAALDVISRLDKVPGQQQRAERFREWIQLHVHAPWRLEAGHPEAHRGFYLGWGCKLLDVGRTDRAFAILREGLPKHPDDPELLAHIALAFALKGRLAESMRAQKSAGFYQVKLSAGYHGLGDILLSKEKPRQAVKSYGDSVPELPEHRRVLAWANAKLGKPKRAEKLLNKDEFVDQLLLIQLWRSTAANEKAIGMGRSIVEQLHIPESGPADFTGSISYSAAPHSLRSEFKSAIGWLKDQFPDKKREVDFFFGAQRPPWRPELNHYTPASVAIVQLEKQLAAANDPETAAELRFLLARMSAIAGHYAKAIQITRVDAAGPRPPDYGQRLTWSAINYSLWRRRADTEKLFQEDPARLAASRAILANLLRHQTRSMGSTPPEKRQAAEDEDVRRLIAIGPGVLAPVIDEFDINTHTWKDRTPHVQVIEALGDVHDTPILIDTLALIANGVENGHVAQQNRNSAVAIHRCLEKLTGQSCPEKSLEGQAKFWNDWWYKNAEAIVYDKVVEPETNEVKSR